MGLFKKKDPIVEVEKALDHEMHEMEHDIQADVDAVMKKYDRESNTRIWGSENRPAGADVGLLNLLYPDDPVQQGASGAAAVPVSGLYHHYRLSGVSRQKRCCPGEPCALV